MPCGTTSASAPALERFVPTASAAASLDCGAQSRSAHSRNHCGETWNAWPANTNRTTTDNGDEIASRRPNTKPFQASCSGARKRHRPYFESNSAAVRCASIWSARLCKRSNSSLLRRLGLRAGREAYTASTSFHTDGSDSGELYTQDSAT